MTYLLSFAVDTDEDPSVLLDALIDLAESLADEFTSNSFCRSRDTHIPPARAVRVVKGSPCVSDFNTRIQSTASLDTGDHSFNSKGLIK